MTVLVGGVGELYQGDLDFGRHVVDALESTHLADDVVVEDLHYGAVAVAQRIEELEPAALILVGAIRRGRRAGTLERRRIRVDRPPADLQRAVDHAVTGYVDIDLVVDVAFALGALPARSVAIELEPVLTGPADHLSADAERLVGEAVRLVRHEARGAALLRLADEVRALQGPDGPVLEPLEALLAELGAPDEPEGWERALDARDRLRDRLAGAPSGDAPGAEDGALAWALIEKLDRLEERLSPPAAG